MRSSEGFASIIPQTNKHPLYPKYPPSSTLSPLDREQGKGRVYGIAYSIKGEENQRNFIQKLNVYEGVSANHYFFIKLTICLHENEEENSKNNLNNVNKKKNEVKKVKKVPAFAYIANPNYSSPFVSPSIDYLSHLLAGELLLPPVYFSFLSSFNPSCSSVSSSHFPISPLSSPSSVDLSLISDRSSNQLIVIDEKIDEWEQRGREGNSSLLTSFSFFSDSNFDFLLPFLSSSDNNNENDDNNDNNHNIIGDNNAIGHGEIDNFNWSIEEWEKKWEEGSLLYFEAYLNLQFQFYYMTKNSTSFPLLSPIIINDQNKDYNDNFDKDKKVKGRIWTWFDEDIFQKKLKEVELLYQRNEIPFKIELLNAYLPDFPSPIPCYTFSLAD